METPEQETPEEKSTPEHPQEEPLDLEQQRELELQKEENDYMDVRMPVDPFDPTSDVVIVKDDGSVENPPEVSATEDVAKTPEGDVEDIYSQYDALLKDDTAPEEPPKADPEPVERKALPPEEETLEKDTAPPTEYDEYDDMYEDPSRRRGEDVRKVVAPLRKEISDLRQQLSQYQTNVDQEKTARDKDYQQEQLSSLRTHFESSGLDPDKMVDRINRYYQKLRTESPHLVAHINSKYKGVDRALAFKHQMDTEIGQTSGRSLEEIQAEAREQGRKEGEVRTREIRRSNLSSSSVSSNRTASHSRPASRSRDDFDLSDEDFALKDKLIREGRWDPESFYN